MPPEPSPLAPPPQPAPLPSMPPVKSPPHSPSASLLLLGGLLVLAVIGGLYYFLHQSAIAPQIADETVTTSTSTETQAEEANTYKDTEFGFTFQKPDSWSDFSIEPLQPATPDFQGVTTLASFAAEDATYKAYQGYQVNVLHFSSNSPTLPDAGCDATYSFNVSLHQWMETVIDCDGASATPQPFDLQKSSTASGLPIFAVQQGLGSVEYIIPLDTNFTTTLEISSLADDREPDLAYSFINSLKVTPIVQPPTVTIDQSSLTFTTTSPDDNQPTISGTAFGIDQIGLFVGGGTRGEITYAPTDYQQIGFRAPDFNGRWSLEMPGSNIDWTPGSYPVQVRNGTTGKVLATGTLKIILTQ